MKPAQVLQVNNVDELLEAVTSGKTQEFVARLYARLIIEETRKPEGSDIRRANRAILDRWKGLSALNRIKRTAWGLVEQREVWR